MNRKNWIWMIVGNKRSNEILFDIDGMKRLDFRGWQCLHCAISVLCVWSVKNKITQIHTRYVYTDWIHRAIVIDEQIIHLT